MANSGSGAWDYHMILFLSCSRISDSGATHGVSLLFAIRYSPFAITQPGNRVLNRHQLSPSVGAALELDLAFCKSSGTDHDLPWNPDEIGSREFRSRSMIEIVIEHVDVLRGQRLIELLASRIRIGAALFEIEDRDI